MFSVSSFLRGWHYSLAPHSLPFQSTPGEGGEGTTSTPGASGPIVANSPFRFQAKNLAKFPGRQLPPLRAQNMTTIASLFAAGLWFLARFSDPGLYTPYTGVIRISSCPFALVGR